MKTRLLPPLGLALSVVTPGQKESQIRLRCSGTVTRFGTRSRLTVGDDPERGDDRIRSTASKSTGIKSHSSYSPVEKAGEPTTK